MLNLVYHETQDEKVYQVISRRMKDRYDIFGGLNGPGFAGGSNS